jgi:hypothetical protein
MLYATLSQACKLENVMPMEKVSVALPKDVLNGIISTRSVVVRKGLTHGDSQEADHNLNAGDPHKSLEDSSFDNPFVGTESQAEREEIL